jgi:hypothetical protein
MRLGQRALDDPARLLLLAPLVFVLHVGEEAPGFVAWFNRLVDPDISTSAACSDGMGCGLAWP